jgi:very-short-patch-repair endonuclease
VGVATGARKFAHTSIGCANVRAPFRLPPPVEERLLAGRAVETVLAAPTERTMPGMNSRRPIPPDLLGRPFTASEAKRRGVRPDRLSDPDLDHPFHGVHGTGLGGDVGTMCAAYRLRMREDAVFTSVTAAQLWDMPLPERLIRDGRLHVGVPLGTPAPRGRGVLGHRLGREPIPLVRLRGLPVLDEAETWCDLGRVLTADELTVVADSLLAPGRADPGEMLALLESRARTPYRRSGSRLLRALARARPGVRSPRETLLRLLIVDSGLPEPEVAMRVFSRTGAYLGEVDLGYRRRRLLLEYEGDHHRTNRGQFRYDIRRREAFEDDGWSVLRVTADDMDVPALRVEFLARLRRRLERAD